MPSQALQKFENRLLTDVHRLVESHNQLNHNGRGRRGLGHITRSGVFLLCAAWERYIEDLAIECTNKLADWAASPEDLPLSVQKEISKYVKSHKHDLKPLELAGNGWEHIYTTHAEALCNSLNTPKLAPVRDLLKRTAGWETDFDELEVDTEFVDPFVSARGDIAHNGSDADYVTLANLENYLRQISALVLIIDNAACDFLNTHTGTRPWRRRTA
ncbi:HEPN domain-containing protein [Aliiroseovarius sp. KMU-50]|uniref:HEPN domain-containing protein n=1 Tax=Aliiroseovarius salicola TaxID=3009082 RepID=A0ABT4VYM6_9RHOB|nr:HEPN domain-containing protein [Aliiroseovarius sp. KMU-50]MDA5093274.1 HEPN domain-containing protein [Aliiroseovarius sp. KMU-50]